MLLGSVTPIAFLVLVFSVFLSCRRTNNIKLWVLIYTIDWHTPSLSERASLLELSSGSISGQLYCCRDTTNDALSRATFHNIKVNQPFSCCRPVQWQSPPHNKLAIHLTTNSNNHLRSYLDTKRRCLVFVFSFVCMNLVVELSIWLELIQGHVGLQGLKVHMYLASCQTY